MLKLVQTDWGRFDLAVDDPAQADADTAAATLVFGVLHTDAEAPASRVDDLFDRRGAVLERVLTSVLVKERLQREFNHVAEDGARFEAPIPLFVLDASQGDAPAPRVLH